MNGRSGIILACLVILALIPEPTLQLAARFLLILFFLSWWLSLVHIKKTKLESEFEHYRIFAHERMGVTIRVLNTSVFSLETAGIADNAGGLHTTTPPVSALSLPGRFRSSLEYSVWSERRGKYQLGPCLVSGTDPLGLFPWTREWPLLRSVIVFPPIYAADLALARGMLGNQKKSSRIEHQDPLETRALRPYQAGDEVRSIHWKQTVKTGIPIVRQYPLIQDIPWHLVLNLRLEDYHPKKRQAHVERCIEAATAFLVEAHHQGTPCRFTMWGSNTPTSSGSHNYEVTDALEQLALVEGAAGLPSPLEHFAHLDLHDKPHLVFISPPLQEPDFLGLIRLLPRVSTCKWILFDEQVDRSDAVSPRDTLVDPKISVWKIHELTNHLEMQVHAHI